jgi:hypothetical protein
MILASRKRVGFSHLAQLTYVSETAVRRVPRISSCITGSLSVGVSVGYDWLDMVSTRMSQAARSLYKQLAKR